MSNMTAAFLGLGMARVDFGRSPHHGERGHIELVSDLISYAPYIDRLFAAGAAVVGQYPGVGEYEVTEPFGEWYTEAMIDCEPGGEPSPELCRSKLHQLMLAFFVDPEKDAPLSVDVFMALRAVPFRGDD